MEEIILCGECDISEKKNKCLIINIIKKINNCQKNDKKKFGIKGDITKEYILELLVKQKLKCYICDIKLNLNNYENRCKNQLSIDRINNNEPHNKNNIMLSCYYCNCELTCFINVDKKCNLICCKEKNEKKMKKEFVSQKEIMMKKQKKKYINQILKICGFCEYYSTDDIKNIVKPKFIEHYNEYIKNDGINGFYTEKKGISPYIKIEEGTLYLEY